MKYSCNFTRHKEVQLKKRNKIEPFVYIKAKDFKLSAIFDTGSSITLMKQSVCDALDDCIKIRKNIKISIIDVNGNSLKCTDFFYINTFLGKHAIVLPCVIVPDAMSFDHDILIGMDVMSAEKIVLNFDLETVEIPGILTTDLKFKTESEIVVTNFIVRKTIPRLRCYADQIIAPGHANIVACGADRRTKHESFLFEPNNWASNHTDSGLVRFNEKGFCNIIWINESEHDVHLKRGTVFGKLKQCELVAIHSSKIFKISKEQVANTKPSRNKMHDKYVWSSKTKEELRMHIDAQDLPDCILDVLAKHRNVIALEGESLGKTDLVELELKVAEKSKPIALFPYKTPHSKEQILKDEIKRLLKEGIISPSISPWAFPAILVGKGGGGHRLVIDYRRLNEILESDKYPIPNITDLIMDLRGGKYFSNLDLLSAYHQISVAESSKPLTAFKTKDAQYCYNVAPFGIKVMPNLFQRLMNKVFEKLDSSVRVKVFLDDILIVSGDIYSHASYLDQVLTCLSEAKLKVKLSKCKFLKTQIDFLGHSLGDEGYKPQINKVRAISEYPRPTNVDKVRQFLGMLGFYRSFIKNFGKIAHPLYALLKNDVKFHWGDEQQQSFDVLRNILMSEKVLAYPDFSKEFYCDTDACRKGIGCIVSQKAENGKLKPISFASRSLTKSELNYSTTDLEALAVVWALRKHRYILLGYRILLFVDHKPLLGLFTKTLPPGRLARWALEVQEYDIRFYYKPGTSNKGADALSRNAIQDDSMDMKDYGLVTYAKKRQDSDISILVDADENCGVWTIKTLIEEQEKDEFFGNIKKKINQYPHFHLRNNIMHFEDKYPVNSTRAGEVRTRVCVPEKLSNVIIQLYHNAECMGHPNGEDLYQRLSSQYVIKNLKEKISQIYCHKCNACTRVNRKPAPLHMYPMAGMPMSEISMDLLGGLPTTKQGYKYIIVFVCRFSRFCILDKLKDKSAESVARSLVDKVFSVFTTPESILADNAKEFIGTILKEVCKMYKVKQSFIVSYHPASAGMVEACNKRVLTVLRKVINHQQNNWDELLPFVQKSLNTQYHSSIRETPHFVMFLQDSKNPMDTLPLLEEGVSHESYIANMLSRQRLVHQKVKEVLENETKKFTDRFNRKAEECKFVPGNRVFIKKRSYADTNKRKLAPLYVGPYRILEKLKANKFRIKHIENQKELIVHADHLKRVSENGADKFRVQKQPVKQTVDEPTVITYHSIPTAPCPVEPGPTEDTQESRAQIHPYSLRPRRNINYAE